MSVEWHFFLHLTHMIGMTSPYSQKSTSFYIALSTLCFRRKLAAVKRGVRGGELRGGIGGVYYLFRGLVLDSRSAKSQIMANRGPSYGMSREVQKKVRNLKVTHFI